MIFNVRLPRSHMIMHGKEYLQKVVHVLLTISLEDTIVILNESKIPLACVAPHGSASIFLVPSVCFPWGNLLVKAYLVEIVCILF